VGNTVIFSASDQLDKPEHALWDVLDQKLDDRWPDDALRLAATLRERKPNSRDYFGRLGAKWEDVRHELYGEDSLTYLSLAMLPYTQTVADLGCGSGRVLSLIAPHVERVIGVDREPAMLEAARARVAEYKNVEVRSGELESPPLKPSEIDLALLNLVLYLVDSPEEILTSLRPALSEGGRVIIIDMAAHNREEYRRTMGHISLGFSHHTLKNIASRSGLRLTNYRTLPPDLAASGPALFTASLELDL
jgi:ArsR family transcriptional regulator